VSEGALEESQGHLQERLILRQVRCSSGVRDCCVSFVLLISDECVGCEKEKSVNITSYKQIVLFNDSYATSLKKHSRLETGGHS